MPNKSALIFGATGLIGGHLLSLVLESSTYERVHVFSRREIGVQHDKVQQHIVDFSQLSRYKKLIKADHLFCCLGTTMSKAGSKAAFREVDYHYPMQIAEMASENGVSKYLVISSVGADPNSMFFYPRVKGEMERGIVLFPFKQISILRPSILLGSREEKRRGEDISKNISTLLSPFLLGPLKKYRGISGKTVAQAMFNIANHPQKKIVFESDDLMSFAQLVL